jgi:hypothetical protein
MTVRAPGTLQAPALEGAPVAAPPVAGAAPFGIVVGGALPGDVIVVSPRALVIVRAGTLVKALVIAGLCRLRRTIALGPNRTLRLHDGIYQVV